MELIFICPRTGGTFFSEDYSLVENRGVISGAGGEKILMATVSVNTPCPHCQELHSFRAEDLACPLTYR
jgi:hypothetical protein